MSPDYEKFFTNEAEAEAFASEMTATGRRAEVVYDMYDYCWSVEVFVARNREPNRSR